MKIGAKESLFQALQSLIPHKQSLSGLTKVCKKSVKSLQKVYKRMTRKHFITFLNVN